MPGIRNGVARVSAVRNGTARVGAVVNGTNRLATGATPTIREFTITDWTGSVQISAAGVITTIQGNSVDPVVVNTASPYPRVVSEQLRSVNVTVVVPNNSDMWTNAGEDVTGNVNATQPQGIFSPTVNIHQIIPSHNAIVLNWTSDRNDGTITMQTVEWGETTAYGNSADVAMPAERAQTYTITGLELETEYFVRVTAVNEAGESTDSASATTTVAPLQPGNIITGISVNADGDLTVTTNDSGFVYYLGVAVNGGTTYNTASNSVTITGLYDIVDDNTTRTPWIGIQVDDSEAVNDGSKLSIRTIQDVTQPPGLPNVTTAGGQGFAGTTSETLEGSINSIGATATSATFYWLISTNSTESVENVRGGTAVNASGTSGAVTASASYPGIFTGTRYIHYLLSASNSRGTSNGAVVSQQVANLTILANTPETNMATEVDRNSARLNGDVTIGGGNSILGLGFIYGTDQAQVILGVNNRTGDPVGTGVTRVNSSKTTVPFFEDITSLNEDTTYYYSTISIGSVGWQWDRTPAIFETNAAPVTYSGTITYSLADNVTASVTPSSYSNLEAGSSITYSGTLTADQGFEFAGGSTTMEVSGTLTVPATGGDITEDLTSNTVIMSAVEFSISNLNVIANPLARIPAQGLSAGDDVSNYVTIQNFEDSVTSIEAGEPVAPNLSTSTTPTINLDIVIEGVIPSGNNFPDPGQPYSFTFNSDYVQAAATSQDATGATLGSTTLTLDTTTNEASTSLSITPSNGRWNITTPNGVTASPSSGIGSPSGNITFTWDGTTEVPARGFRFQVRRSRLSTGSVLASGTIQGLQPI